MNQTKEIEEKCGELIKVDFPLGDSPRDVQLTYHINNVLLTYPARKKEILECFKKCLNKKKLIITYNDKFHFDVKPRIQQIVDIYGIPACRNWFKLIYGWEIKKGKVS